MLPNKAFPSINLYAKSKYPGTGRAQCRPAIQRRYSFCSSFARLFFGGAWTLRLQSRPGIDMNSGNSPYVESRGNTVLNLLLLGPGGRQYRGTAPSLMRSGGTSSFGASVGPVARPPDPGADFLKLNLFRSKIHCIFYCFPFFTRLKLL